MTIILDLGRTNSLRKYTTGLLAIIGQRALLDQNPLLVRSINKNRLPLPRSAQHEQIELLKRHRASNTDERVVQAIHLTINGIAAGLRNSA